MTNLEFAELLRKVAAAYQILGENRFKIIAYERAADSIEHLTSELKDYWDEKKLGDIPGLGSSIQSHLDEYFRTGKSKHFDEIMGKLPKPIFPLLLVPGIGPKKAFKLVKELKLSNEKTVIEDLEIAAAAGKIASMEGFGEKSQAEIIQNIAIFKKGQIKENRMALPIADGIAQSIIKHLEKLKSAEKINVLGSLRRKVSTIGDIDIAVATNEPEEIINHFLLYPHDELIEKGPTGTSVRLHNGRQVDLRVQKPELFGAMLQYFTGSKNHNISLRSYGLSKGLSLNEYGIKHTRNGKVESYTNEHDFYHALGLEYIEPELREDKGEIPAAFNKSLPKLVDTKNILGDLHIHTSYDLKPSHDLGANAFADYLTKAEKLGYEYIGISDHNPSTGNHTKEEIVSIMKRRKQYYEQQYSSKNYRVHYFLMCEVDIQPDGTLALPDKAFEYVDAVLVSLHSAFTQTREKVTERVIKALTHHPKVRIMAHPTGRLLGRREEVDANWKEIMAICKERDIALEINAYPDRLDLPDMLVYDAIKHGGKLCIDTDAHSVDHMDLMQYGVSVARRGWAQKDDIINTLSYNKFKRWLLKEDL